MFYRGIKIKKNMFKTIGRKKDYKVEHKKFRTGKKEKDGKPIFEERVILNFCGDGPHKKNRLLFNEF